METHNEKRDIFMRCLHVDFTPFLELPRYRSIASRPGIKLRPACMEDVSSGSYSPQLAIKPQYLAVALYVMTMYTYSTSTSSSLSSTILACARCRHLIDMKALAFSGTVVGEKMSSAAAWLSCFLYQSNALGTLQPYSTGSQR